MADKGVSHRIDIDFMYNVFYVDCVVRRQALQGRVADGGAAFPRRQPKAGTSFRRTVWTSGASVRDAAAHSLQRTDAADGQKETGRKMECKKAERENVRQWFV